MENFVRFQEYALIRIKFDVAGIKKCLLTILLNVLTHLS